MEPIYEESDALRDKIIDLAERVFWTFVAAGLAAIPVIISDLDPWLVVPITAGINAALVWVRQRVPGLPDPGAGLPGLRKSGT